MKNSLSTKAEIGERCSLVEKLEHGILDIVVVQRPEYRPIVQVEQLLDEMLIHLRSVVSAVPYVNIDRGEYLKTPREAVFAGTP